MKESLAHDLSARSESDSLSSVELAHQVVSVCSEAQGRDLSVLEVSEIFPLSDFFIVVSGRSDRHVQGIANRVIEELAKYGASPVAIEGVEKGHWVLVDFGEVVLHVFYEPAREHYDVESLWVRAPRVSLNAEKGGKIKVKKLPMTQPRFRESRAH